MLTSKIQKDGQQIPIFGVIPLDIDLDIIMDKNFLNPDVFIRIFKLLVKILTMFKEIMELVCL